MRFAKVLISGLTVALCGVACNPSAFDSALEKAPVVSFDNGSSNGSLYVLPLQPPAPGGKVSARMLVARKDTAEMSIAEYDKDGKVTLQQATDSDKANLGNTPVNSAAALGPDGPIILGTPRFGATGAQAAPGRVDLLTVSTQADGSASMSVQPGVQGADHFGISVAAGRVTDLAGSPQFVVVSDFTVQVLAADARTPIVATDCQLLNLVDPTAGLNANRPVAVGDLVPGGGEEIVLSGLGRVVLVQYNPATLTLGCFSPPGLQVPAISFGTSLAIGDFDGDQHLDLAVGTPPDRVYVYFGPFAPDAVSIPTTTIVSTGSAAFAKRMATYTVPGQLVSQLMVADPSATVNGRSGAGRVMLLNAPRLQQLVDVASLTISTVFDSNGDSPASVFGDSLGGLSFDTRTCNPAGGVMLLPWATSATSVLTYFNYPTTPAAPPPAPVVDPRCFMK
jgi:hypothetical protein